MHFRCNGKRMINASNFIDQDFNQKLDQQIKTMIKNESTDQKRDLMVTESEMHLNCI